MRVVPLLFVALIVAQSAAAQTSSVIAPSYHFPQVRPPVHKIDQPMELNLQTLRYHPEEISKVTMSVYTDQNGGAPGASWQFGPRDQVVLLERLALLEQPTVPVPDEYTAPRKYTSIELTFERRDGRKMPRLAVFKNSAVIEGDRSIWVDPENRLEKWLFSSARTFEDRVFANTALNVQTFRDCQWAGNLVVDTTNPNQCIMPDGTLFLKLAEDDNVAFDPNMTTYDACYKAKRPVLDEFPRKCVLPGGRVLVEPARLKKDTPAPVKAAKKAKAKKAKPQAQEATPVSEAVVPTDITAIPQTTDLMSDVPAPITAPAPAKKATPAKKGAKGEVKKLPEKTSDDKPTPAQPVVVETDAKALEVPADKAIVVQPKTLTTAKPDATAKPAAKAAAPVAPSKDEKNPIAPAKPKPAAKAATLPAVANPQEGLQVVTPDKPSVIEDTTVPTND